MKQTYLDYAAATPVRKEVAKAMQKFFSEDFANPSSAHAAGKKTQEKVEEAREKIRQVLQAENASEIIFTGSGTESINLAIKGVMRAYKNKGNHIITTKIEHNAVLETCAYLEKHENCTVTYLDVDEFGRINLCDVEKAIKPKTVLISVMYANNEIGTIQPITEIAKIARAHNVFFHSDACQAAGALEINVQQIGVDLLTLNGSKIYGPKGIGLLYVRRKIDLFPLIHGGGQEFGFRSGTENVAGIAGLAVALELAEKERVKEAKRLCTLRNYFIERVLTEVQSSRLNGCKLNNTSLTGSDKFSQRLPNNVNISFADVDAETLLKVLSAERIYVSAGSACTTNSVKISHVLKAIKVSEELAMGTLRLTLGRDTTKKKLDRTLSILKESIKAIRKSKN